MKNMDKRYQQCSELGSHSKIVVSEQKCKFVIKNPKHRAICKVKVDGCLPLSAIKCDYLFELTHSKEVLYVELKGKDIRHALEQLLATMTNDFIQRRHVKHKKTCIVVSSRVPKEDTTSQRLKKRIRKNASLKTGTRVYEVTIP